MNAESIRVRNEAWSDWEGRVVNGTFPLRRFLGSSNHSAVFLTEYKALNLLREVAIKFLPADNLHTEAQQLVQWGAAASISHPHLVRLFDAGRCQVGGRAFLFAVMEYAEQTLSEILPKRPLTGAEVREMLPATLDALAFLHRNNLVHGHLKPTNIVVVNDQVKLSCDTVRSPGHSNTIVRTYLYDPPELAATGTSTAADIWALGVTLVEALTQRYPVPDERSQTPLLPAGLPPEFIGTVRRCLSRAPANRPTVVELEAQYKPAPPPEPAPAPEPPVLSPAQALPELPEESPSARTHSPRGRFLVTTLSVTLLIIAAAWVIARFFLGTPNIPLLGSDAAQIASNTDSAEGDSGSSPVADTTTGAAASAGVDANGGTAAGSGTTPGSGMPPASSAAASANSTTIAEEAGGRSGAIRRNVDSAVADAGAVIHQVLPDVAPDILNKIHGHIVVKVRVLVDATGDVVGQFVESPGPSKFFARSAADAAAEWKFAPTSSRDSRVWLLRFEFDRSGAKVETTAAP